MNDTQRKLEQLNQLLAQSDLPADDPVRKLAEALVPDESYTHEQAEHDLPAYVMDEMLGRPVARLYPELHRHLLHCEQCAELHAFMLEDLVEEPAPVSIPEPDLSFLPPVGLQKILQNPREAISDATTQIVKKLWPDWAADLDATLSIFFEKIGSLDASLTLQPAQARAMGFTGGDVSPPTRAAAISLQAHAALREAYQASDRVERAALQAEAERIARRAAHEMGLRGNEQRRFVEAYVAWVMTGRV